MKRAFIFWLCTVAFILSVRAQTNAPAPVNKRVLLILETSTETKSLAGAQREVTSALIESGMAELLGEGDTLGIWTFNDKVYTGLLPMQIWKTESAKEISERVSAFLKLQKYEKKPNLTPVWSPLGAVIRKSPVLTVVLITSGKSPVFGTPYDNEINLYYKDHEREFRKKKMPFVTMFLTRRGKVLRYSVGPALGDVKIPKLPPEDPIPVIVTNTPAMEKAPAAKYAGKALVITKSGAATTSLEQAEEVAAKIETSVRPTENRPKPVLRKNDIPNLPPGTVIVTGDTQEKYLLKSPTNAVLLERTELTNPASTNSGSTNTAATPP